MIASLPMYDRPETADANDRLWDGVRRRLPDPAPEQLTRVGDLWEHWEHPGLVLSQTCGLPYRQRLHGRVALVAAPVFDLPNLPPGHYRSVFVVRGTDHRDSLADFATARFAYNERSSQSGWAAPQTHMTAGGLPPFSNVVATGSHRASSRLVAEGGADIACLDCVTWRMIARWDPWAANLRELDVTRATPAMPYIAAAGRDADASARALAGAIGALSPGDRAALCLLGITRVPAEAYLSVPDAPAVPEKEADAG